MMILTGSVFISSALQNSLCQLNVPFMTLPFNFVAVICFLTWQTDQSEVVELSGNSSLEVGRLVEGAVLSLGQVYAIHGLAPSLVMWAAVSLYSPLLASLSALGASIGSLLPLLLLGR